ncbi:hypothetical protein JZ751_025155 [Albula glossodonta]|uniref:IGFBP N-terminal domain-containing protein n=1 Tax=Albula glossodonta TaxID=121402 RepID=A0A8T2PD28_9TELE|nr:hypothetical protein JZ751_025155 [Albula glossodonta]
MRVTWVLLWFWVCWFGLCCSGEDEQMWLSLGQACGGTVQGMCDGNLTCVPREDSFIEGEAIDPGVCALVPPPAGCTSKCSGVQCPERLMCRAGVVTDPCGCCTHCARQQGQVCGGRSWERGYCDRGLTCALFQGLIPGLWTDHLADPLCPWVFGCRVRMGSCDCFGLKTCHSISYRSLKECNKYLIEQLYWDSVGPYLEEEPCMYHGCVIEGDRCVCKLQGCDSQALTRDACLDLLEMTRCSNVSCPKLAVPTCPHDSFLTEPYTPPKQCCPLVPALCTCNFVKCPSAPSACPPGHRVHRISKGNGHPGNCCNRYQCRPGEEKPAVQERDEKEEEG